MEEVLRLVLSVEKSPEEKRSDTTSTDTHKAPCENEVKQRTAIMLTLRDMVIQRYQYFYLKSCLSVFKAPTTNSFTAAECLVFSILSIILGPIKEPWLKERFTDATPKAMDQALAMWWLATWDIGGSPAEGVEIRMQELRYVASNASRGGIWNSNGLAAAKAEVAFMRTTCDFARGLAEKFPAASFPVIKSFEAELDKITVALQSEFPFEPVAMKNGPLGMKYM